MYVQGICEGIVCCSNDYTDITVSILHQQNGWNALHLATFLGHLEMAKHLLLILGEKKFDVDSRGI